jgi:DNA polymerase V
MSSFDALRSGAAVGADPSLSPTGTGPTASAGFGSPGTDSTVKRIDLNDALIRHPQSTFAMRAAGTQMRDAGIDDGDVLLVDRTLTPMHGHVVVAVVESELVCRRLFKQGAVVKLQAALSADAAEPTAADVDATDAAPIEIWGVVTTVIKSLVS